MSLGDGLQKMSLKETGGHDDDPTTEAARRGVAPTLRDVKKSVKVAIRKLPRAHQFLPKFPPDIAQDPHTLHNANGRTSEYVHTSASKDK